MGLQVSIDSFKQREPVQDMIQPGVLADIVDKGLVPNKFKPGTMQHKCYFTWLVAEEDSEGRNKYVFESFTVSFNEKATLRKRLKEFGVTEAEFKASKTNPIDLDRFIGTKRMLVLSTEDGQDGGDPFIKVMGTTALQKGVAAPDIPAEFVRKQDRPAK